MVILVTMLGTTITILHDLTKQLFTYHATHDSIASYFQLETFTVSLCQILLTNLFKLLLSVRARQVCLLPCIINTVHWLTWWYICITYVMLFRQLSLMISLIRLEVDVYNAIIICYIRMPITLYIHIIIYTVVKTDTII